MSETIILKAKKREIIGSKVKTLRAERLLPAVIYGLGASNQNISLNYVDFEKVFKKAGESTLIDLLIDEGKPVKVIVQDLSFDPLSHQYQHVDFYQVRMDRKLKAKLAINFIGEASAVKELGAVLLKNINEIEIECLPQDLQHQVDVDLAGLKAIGDKITVADLNLPKSIEVLTDQQTVIALTETLHVEEVVETTKEAEVQAIESVEAEKEKKTEDGEEVASKPEERKKEKNN